MHSNYPAARGALTKAVRDGAMLVGCRKSDVLVPANGASKPFDIDAIVQKMLPSRQPILVAAGPLAPVLIHRYWTKCPPAKRVAVLDVGACLDHIIHGRVTRDHHNDNSPLRYHVCSFDHWTPWSKRPVNPNATRKEKMQSLARATREGRVKL
jgi:hypothetical protein